MTIEELIEKYKNRYKLLNIPWRYELEHKARKSELQNIIQDLQSLQPTTEERKIKWYFVVEDNDDIEQLSIVFDTYEEALNYLKDEYTQKIHPNAYIAWKF